MCAFETLLLGLIKFDERIACVHFKRWYLVQKIQ